MKNQESLSKRVNVIKSKKYQNKYKTKVINEWLESWKDTLSRKYYNSEPEESQKRL